MEYQEIVKRVSDGFERAKGGEAADVYAEVAKYHADGVLPLKSHYAFGWIIYYAIHQSAPNAIKERKQMLARYLSLQVEKPHKLHSMILTEAIRLYKDAVDAAYVSVKNGESGRSPDIIRFSIVKFCDLWGLPNLRPGDWRRKEHEGKELPSTVEKLITGYVDELYSARTPASPEFIAIVEKALAEYPASANLSAQCAQLHELADDREGAIRLLRETILASSSKFFLWSRLAALITNKDLLRLRISLFYKSLQCPGQEDFKGRIHLSLAETLAEGGAFAQAKWELDYVKDLYGKKNWNLPRIYREVEKKIPEGIQPVDPTPAYRKVAPLADDFIYESLPNIDVKKTYHKPAAETTDRYGRRRAGQCAWRVTDATGTNYWLTPSRFGFSEYMPIGTPLKIKIFAGKVVRASV